MIAKIVKGSGFREVTGYIIDSKKNARIIAHAGLFIEDVTTITKAFEGLAKSIGDTMGGVIKSIGDMASSISDGLFSLGDSINSGFEALGDFLKEASRLRAAVS